MDFLTSTGGWRCRWIRTSLSCYVTTISHSFLMHSFNCDHIPYHHLSIREYVKRSCLSWVAYNELRRSVEWEISLIHAGFNALYHQFTLSPQSSALLGECVTFRVISEMEALLKAAAFREDFPIRSWLGINRAIDFPFSLCIGFSRAGIRITCLIAETFVDIFECFIYGFGGIEMLLGVRRNVTSF